MKALILAAGRGTRMGALTARRPKPMVPLLGRPILEWIVERLKWAGVDESIIVTGYRAEAIESHFGAGERFGLRIRYRRQETQDGNARAIALGRDCLAGEPFFLLFGDVIADAPNYADLAKAYADEPADLLMTVVRLDDVSGGSAVEFDERGEVFGIEEKPDPALARSHWNSAGIFIARPVLFEHIEDIHPSRRGEYELTDAIGSMIREPGLSVRARKIKGFWGDLAGADELARMEEILRREIKK